MTLKEAALPLVRLMLTYPPLRTRWARREIEAWERSGRPAPPPDFFKQQVLVDIARRYRLTVLVETGTSRGDMIAAVLDEFERIYSIELGVDLYEKARKRFRGKANVRLLCGDSGILVGEVMPLLDRPALFWLDGHYSGGKTALGEQETPVLQELEHILEAPDIGHVLIIDDARFFGRASSYPTLETVRSVVGARWPDAHFSVENDSIRIVPARYAEQDRVAPQGGALRPA